MEYLSLKLIYIANIMVAGYVGVASLFFPGLAGENLFSGLSEGDVAIRITGAFWIAIALLSVAGLFLPIKMVPVLIIQLIYKGLWLLTFALPALVRNELETVPHGMALFFLVWVVALAFVIPFRVFLS